MTGPRVSVVIPLYNNAGFIRRAIESVLAQTFDDFGVIVVNDGSTDGGGEIARRVNDSRITVVDQINRGVSAARNKGVELGTAPFVAFLDADDQWLPDFLKTVTDLESRFPQAAMFGTGYRIRKASGRLLTPIFADVPTSDTGGLIENYFAAALKMPPICSSCVMVRRQALKEVGGFPANVRMGEDTITWMRIALRYPAAWSPAAGAIYHQGGEDRVCRAFHYGEPPHGKCLDDYLRENVLPDAVYESAREYVVKNRLIAVMDNWLAGRTKIARNLLIESADTRRFRRQWLFWRLVTMFPQSWSVAAWRAAAVVLRRGSVDRPVRSIYREDY